MPSAPATSHKGRRAQGKEQGPGGDVSCFKVVRDRLLGGTGGRWGKALGTLRVESGAKVSEFTSGRRLGRELGSCSGGGSALEKEGGREGRKVEAVELDLEQLQGLGAIAGGLWTEGSEGRRISEQRSGDIA